MESLAITYRPTTFDDLVGQRAVNVVLRQMVATGQIPTALAFTGSHGTGKTTTARILAAALNCENPPGPCTNCVSCKAVATGRSMDLLEIDAASHGLVDDIRALRQQVLYATGGRWRVVVLDEAQSMSQPAFNALLKTLEEPPPATTFVLCTTEPARIPDTVRSRCMPFAFHAIAEHDITARLATIAAAEHLNAEPALLTLIAQHADGALRDAIMTLDQLTRAGVGTVAGYTDLIGDTDAGPALLAALASGDYAAGYAETDTQLAHGARPAHLVNALTRTLRDVLVLRSGGTLTCQGAALAARTALAERLDTPALVAAMAILWDLKTRTVGTGDARAALDLAVVLITDKLAPSSPPHTLTLAPLAPPARTLSLADMAALT